MQDSSQVLRTFRLLVPFRKTKSGPNALYQHHAAASVQNATRIWSNLLSSFVGKTERFESSGRGIPELLIQREDMLQKIKATLRIRLWMNSTWTTQHAWIIMNHQPPTNQSINSEQNHRESGTLSSTMVPMFLRPLNDSDSLRPSSFILVSARVLGFVRSRRSSTKLALKSKDVGIEHLKWRS